MPQKIQILKEELKKILKEKNVCDEKTLLIEERELLKKIRSKTDQLNKNNVTRTKAYLDFYLRYPEIHWAFLGHMVSRNGGWNMTDLKGEFLPKLMSRKTRENFFLFLERGNWLIFQDVYPQFLLYEESEKRSQNMFYLLNYLNISLFMGPIWKSFWKTKDSAILTMALIINEQSYLEKRVIQNPYFEEKVLKTIQFVMQDWLTFNQILLPFNESVGLDNNAKLIGLSLHYFESLHERIILGKKLYHLLFQDKKVLEQVKQFAVHHPHSGSRKDYWPHLFNSIKEELPCKKLSIRLEDCKLKKGSKRIYSPKLENAWNDIVHAKAELGDWFNDWKVINYFIEEVDNIDGQITSEYCKTIETLELAAIAKKTLF